MLAPRELPAQYKAWNEKHHAPHGRRGKSLIKRFGPRHRALALLLSPYGWQRNSSLRAFEYPWASDELGKLGNHLSVVDVGAGLAGFQFTLARTGYEVHAVDPGLNAKGRGWELDPEQHALLCETYRAPVTLHPTTLADAGLRDHSMDALVSISTIEHFAPGDLQELARESARILRPGGHLALTIDLFLDLEPFTSRTTNEYGANMDVKQLLDSMGATLVRGDPAQLYGFPEFDSERLQSQLSEYLIGDGYPALSQCLVARLANGAAH